MTTPQSATKIIRRNGRIAELRRARKDYKCNECGNVIEKGSLYFSVVIGGGGLGSLKYPDRCHLGCADQFLNKQINTCCHCGHQGEDVNSIAHTQIDGIGDVQGHACEDKEACLKRVWARSLDGIPVIERR